MSAFSTLTTPLREQQEATLEPVVSGHWQSVRVCADPASGDWMTVGVIVTDSHGTVHCRMLDRYQGVSRLYDGLFPEHDFSLYVEQIEAVVRRSGGDEACRVFAPFVSLGGHPRPINGDSVEHLLFMAYDASVTLGRAGRGGKQRFTSVSTPSLRHTVFDAMRNAPGNLYRWVQEDGYRVAIKGRDTWLDVSLASANALGVVVSAYHLDAKTIRRRIKDAVQVLKVASRHSRCDHFTLSILIPDLEAIHGLTDRELSVLRSAVETGLAAASDLELVIIQAHTSDVLIRRTLSRWKVITRFEQTYP